MLEEANLLVEEKQYERSITEYFVVILNLIVAPDKTRSKSTILNLTIFRKTCFQVATCLKEFKEYPLAGQFIHRANQAIQVSVIHSNVVSNADTFF